MNAGEARAEAVDPADHRMYAPAPVGYYGCIPVDVLDSHAAEA